MVGQPFGGDRDGGDEWQDRTRLSVEHAAQHQRAITLDQETSITRLTSVRNGAKIPNADINALLVLSLE
jgi:hypothetical protein